MDAYQIMLNAGKEKEQKSIVSCNDITAQFGLVLSAEDAIALQESRNESLRTHQRVEFGAGILEKLIYAFADSQYINQSDYLDTLIALQEVFYLFKNESMDLLSDDELISFMEEQFEGVCYGDMEYLSGTCLEIFVAAVRAGYDGYLESGGKGEYGKFDEVKRWDKDLYFQVLKELCWE